MLMRGFIRRYGYETSYTCLARRAAKSNNFWNRLVRRGSIMRRISMYGALQLAFTIICCTVFLPTYFSNWLALAFQVGRRAGRAGVGWNLGQDAIGLRHDTCGQAAPAWELCAMMLPDRGAAVD
jgi:hypothetical protein